MKDGRVEIKEEVVEYYNSGIKDNEFLSRRFRNLDVINNRAFFNFN